MAKLVLDDSYPSKISPVYSWWRVGLAGAGLGAIYWLLSTLLVNFVVDPIFCGSSFEATVCANSVAVSGDIANVLVIMIGLLVLVKLAVLRPLIIAVASAAVLWGLSGWTEGLGWAEVALWDVLLFSLSYLSFSWISRHTHSLAVMASVVVVVVVIRVLLSF